MDVTALTITEGIAILSFGGGLIYSFAKFHTLFTRMDKTLDELNRTIKELEATQADYSTRLTRLEEQIKTLFHQLKQLGGK
jgi:flagellar capping protein FliD